VIRFSPDTWWDAVMRPIAMAAPNGGVYVETVAPDFRFVFVLLLLVLVLFLRRREKTGTRAAFGLLAFCAVAFVPWLATTGNGRYFMSVLWLAGPLCVALLWQMRVTRALRLSLLAGMIALQLFLVQQNTPWDSWGLKPWKDGAAFAVDVPEDLRQRPATYITLSNISYSLIAYQFHPASRWANLTTQTGDDDQSLAGRRTKAFLAAAGETYVLFPSGPGEAVLGQPPLRVVQAQDEMLGGHGLGVRSGVPCRLLHSEGLTNLGLHRQDAPITAPADQRGFWLCPVEKRTDSAPRDARQPPADIEAALDKVERTCPRMFPPGEARTSLMPNAARRFYPSSDMRLYVFQDRQVAYKYMRALNPVVLGRIEEVLANGFRMECDHIRGRSGLPWEREI
jgi:hypothetical protein